MNRFIFAALPAAFIFSAPQLAFAHATVPVIQESEKGSQKWVETAAPGQDTHAPGKPAPVLTVTDDTPAPAYSLGALSVSAPWTRATPKGADVAGGYMSITNSGKEADRLLGGSASIAGRFELHEMATVDGVMKMREFAAGIEIRPGETLVFKPGGLHIMLMGLKKQVKEGDRIEAVLKFEKAGTLDIAFTAAAIGAVAPAAGQGHDHAH